VTLGEAKGGLLGLLANEPAKVFESVGAALERLGAGGIQHAGRMLLDETAQRHNGAQRLGPAPVEGFLGPLTAGLAEDRRSADPITALWTAPGRSSRTRRGYG
jgi:hypothetical protein